MSGSVFFCAAALRWPPECSPREGFECSWCRAAEWRGAAEFRLHLKSVCLWVRACVWTGLGCGAAGARRRGGGGGEVYAAAAATAADASLPSKKNHLLPFFELAKKHSGAWTAPRSELASTRGLFYLFFCTHDGAEFQPQFILSLAWLVCRKKVTSNYLPTSFNVPFGSEKRREITPTRQIR